MKRTLTSLALAAALATSVIAADHDHAKKEAGPNGGRVIHSVEPHAEFLVTKERKIEVRFLDDSGKVIPPAAQTVTVTMGDRSAPTKLSFAKEGDALVSSAAIPEGNDTPTVVQIKVSPEAKTVTEKLNLNLNNCPECDHAEYACTCAHAE
jgi:hypothetical protein